RSLTVAGPAVNVPSAFFVTRVGARTRRGGAGGLLGVKDDYPKAFTAVGAAQPLAADEAGLLPGPVDDVLAQVTLGLVDACRVDGHSNHDGMHGFPLVGLVLV